MFVNNASLPSIAPQEDVDGNDDGIRARPPQTTPPAKKEIVATISVHDYRGWPLEASLFPLFPKRERLGASTISLPQQRRSAFETLHKQDHKSPGLMQSRGP